MTHEITRGEIIIPRGTKLEYKIGKENFKLQLAENVNLELSQASRVELLLLMAIQRGRKAK